MLSIHHFSSRFCNDSLVFSAQKFEIVTSKDRKVTDDKSAFMPRTDGVRPMYRWRLHIERSATFPTANRIVCGILSHFAFASSPCQRTSFPLHSALQTSFSALVLTSQYPYPILAYIIRCTIPIVPHPHRRGGKGIIAVLSSEASVWKRVLPSCRS